MRNMQTCSVADVDALVAVVGLPHSKAIKIARDVISCPGVHVPGRVDVVAVGGSVGGGLFVVVGVVVAVVAADRAVANLVTDLTHRARCTRGVRASLPLSAVAASLRRRASAATTTTLAASTALVAVAATASSLLVAAAASIVGAPTLLTASEVGGGPAIAERDLGVVLLVALLEGEEVGVDLVERDVVVARGEGGDEGIVVRAEAGQDVGDFLLFTQGLADGGQRVCQGLHLAEVVGGRSALLLGRAQLGTDLDDPSTGPGGKHPLQHKPRISCRGGAHDGREDFLGDGGEEATKHRLVAHEPGGVVRIGDLSCHRLIAGADDAGDGWGRRSDGPIDVAEEHVAPEMGDHLSAPWHEVGIVQPDGDGGGDRHGRCDGGGRRGHEPRGL